MLFRDRIEAGQKLAKVLLDYKDKNIVVYGLPRGGVVVAAEIAIALNAHLDVVIVRKIGHPFNPEYAICAVAEDGHMICNEAERAGVDQTWFDQERKKQQNEATRRRKAYLGDRKRVSARDKIAILVDDGVATGLTFLLAVDELRHTNPKKIIAALPVAPRDTANQIRQEVDKLVCLEIPKFFMGSVGAYYEDFPQITDQEVVAIMNSFPF